MKTLSKMLLLAANAADKVSANAKAQADFVESVELSYPVLKIVSILNRITTWIFDITSDKYYVLHPVWETESVYPGLEYKVPVKIQCFAQLLVCLLKLSPTYRVLVTSKDLAIAVALSEGKQIHSKYIMEMYEFFHSYAVTEDNLFTVPPRLMLRWHLYGAIQGRNWVGTVVNMYRNYAPKK